jgi:hypothetical protein
MVAGCDRKAYTRGVCHSCYETFRKAKEAGLITDEEAVAAGLILGKGERRRSAMKLAIDRHNAAKETTNDTAA